jgi:L-asparaginase
MSRVLVIYTGGTMGMQPGADGALRPKKGFLTSMIPTCEELLRPGMPEVVVEEYEPLLDSSDMGPEDWVKIARTIETNYYDFSGFVVIHGTDTMAYTASALSFMFSNLAKPVVMVGAMLPFGEVHSDARRNLACSILIAGTCGDILPEVCIFFNDRLVRGNRATKIDSQAIGAFDSPNMAPLAIMGTEMVLNKPVILPSPKGRFSLTTDLETKVLVIRLVPGFANLEAIVSSDVKAVVLLLYGTGNAPARRTGFINWVKQLLEKNVTVVACSQCLKGTVELEDYAVGKQLADAGVLSAMDMTCEAAVTKIAFLLAKSLPMNELREAFHTSLRGELTSRGDKSNLIKTLGTRNVHIKQL